MRHVQDVDHFAHRHDQLRRAVHGAIKRLAAKATNVQAQLAAAEKAAATRKQADLLTANLHRCLPGATCIQVRLRHAG